MRWQWRHAIRALQTFYQNKAFFLVEFSDTCSAKNRNLKKVLEIVSEIFFLFILVVIIFFLLCLLVIFRFSFCWIFYLFIFHFGLSTNLKANIFKLLRISLYYFQEKK